MLAVVYLAAFGAMLVGIVWTLVNQLTGRAGVEVTAGVVLFLGGQLTIVGLAHRLRAGTEYSRAWQRLSLGLEVRPALRAAAG